MLGTYFCLSPGQAQPGKAAGGGRWRELAAWGFWALVGGAEDCHRRALCLVTSEALSSQCSSFFPVSSILTFLLSHMYLVAVDRGYRNSGSFGAHPTLLHLAGLLWFGL